MNCDFILFLFVGLDLSLTVQPNHLPVTLRISAGTKGTRSSLKQPTALSFPLALSHILWVRHCFA